MSGRPTSFYYSFLALPADRRQAIIAVWDFCRAVDDAVDEPGVEAPAEAVERWRDEVRRLYGAGAPLTPQGRHLLPHVSTFKLPRSAFDDLIDGVAMDLERSHYATFEDLKQYCLRVASAVGLLCVEIFGYRDVQARDYAVDIGIALKMTNIILDVRSDLERGRVYIPQEDLTAFGCSEDDLRSGVMTDNLRRLLVHQVDRAKSFYERADAKLPKHDAARLVAARIMGAIYRDLLGAIERNGYDVFRMRPRVARPRQAVIAAVTWLRSMVQW